MGSSVASSWLDRLVGIDAIQFILQHHHEFQFLNAVEDTKHRTTFYSVCLIYSCCVFVTLPEAIGRVLTLDATEDQGRFEGFMQPFTSMCRAVQSELSSPVPNYQQLKVRTAMLS